MKEIYELSASTKPVEEKAPSPANTQDEREELLTLAGIRHVRFSNPKTVNKLNELLAKCGDR